MRVYTEKRRIADREYQRTVRLIRAVKARKLSVAEIEFDPAIMDFTHEDVLRDIGYTRKFREQD